MALTITVYRWTMLFARNINEANVVFETDNEQHPLDEKITVQVVIYQP